MRQKAEKERTEKEKKETAARDEKRLETMLVEVEEKYGCYALIRECILIPPGLLSRKELEEYFPIGQQAVLQ